MYINENGWNLFRSASEKTGRVRMAEAAAPDDDNSPGFAPVSPDTPSWGPPSGDDSPGFAPISPDTPSWGPPSGDNSPGFAPISPDTPSWGPPQGGTGSGGSRPPLVILPGQGGCLNCSTGSSKDSVNVRFLHAAVNQPAVNVRLGNRTVINHLQFGNATPYYLEGSGKTLVTVVNSQTGSTIFRRYLNFSSRNAYTVSIVNDGTGITLFTLTDTPCNNRNSACLRAVNLSPNSGPVDVFLSGYGRVFQRIAQLDVSSYLAVNPGSYRVSVSEALPCTNNQAVMMADTYAECNNTRIAYMDTSVVNMMSGVTYTLYFIGLAYQFPSLQILALESDLIY